MALIKRLHRLFNKYSVRDYTIPYVTLWCCSSSSNVWCNLECETLGNWEQLLECLELRAKSEPKAVFALDFFWLSFSHFLST